MTFKPKPFSPILLVLGLGIPLLLAILSVISLQERGAEDSFEFRDGKHPNPTIEIGTGGVEQTAGETDDLEKNLLSSPSLRVPSDQVAGLVHTATDKPDPDVSVSENLSRDATPTFIPLPHSSISLTTHKILPGGRAEPLLTIQSVRGLSRVTFRLEFPGDQMIVSAPRSTGNYPGVQCSSTLDYGRLDVEVAFDEIYESFEGIALLTFRASVGDRARVGSALPLRVASATGWAANGERLDLETENGALLVVNDLVEPFRLATLPSSVKDTGESSSLEATEETDSLAQPTAPPTPVPPPTPPPARHIWIGETWAAPSDVAWVPVFISEAEGVQGAQFNVAFDPALLTFKRLRTGEAFGGFYAFANGGTGTAIAAMAGPSPSITRGETILCYLGFDVAGALIEDTGSWIDLEEPLIASPDGPLHVDAQPGALFVTVEPQVEVQPSEKRSISKPLPPKLIHDEPSRITALTKSKNRTLKAPPENKIYDLNNNGEIDVADLIVLIEFMKNQ